MNTLEDALDNATDGLTTEEDLEVSSKEESTEESQETEEDQTSEDESTEEESSEESEDEDKSTDESKKSDKPDEKESEDENQESFTKIDPNELPDEVKPVYKSLLADYTRKRQQESKLVKDVQAENEQLKQQLSQGGGQRQTPGQVKIDLTPEQIGEMTLPEYTNYVINAALQAGQQTQASKEVETFETEAVTGFLSMDARLNPELESSYDPRFATNIGNKVDQDYEAHIAKTGSPVGFDYKASAEKHIKEWDEWVAGIKKESVKNTSKASKQKAKKLRKSAPPTTQARSKTSEKMDLGGAIDAAFNSDTE